MSKYHVEVSKQAERQISKLPKRDKQAVLEAIISLADNPRPHGYKNSNTTLNTPATVSAITA
ncbi:MAG: type II toxin-antitoxin system RelE family toxin [Pyrinomonadaceae bacterium]